MKLPLPELKLTKDYVAICRNLAIMSWHIKAWRNGRYFVDDIFECILFDHKYIRTPL